MFERPSPFRSQLRRGCVVLLLTICQTSSVGQTTRRSPDNSAPKTVASDPDSELLRQSISVLFDRPPRGVRIEPYQRKAAAQTLMFAAFKLNAALNDEAVAAEMGQPRIEQFRNLLSQATPKLKRLANDSDEEVRVPAGVAVSLLKPKEAVAFRRAFLAALAGKQTVIGSFAIIGLHQIDPRAADRAATDPAIKRSLDQWHSNPATFLHSMLEGKGSQGASATPKDRAMSRTEAKSIVGLWENEEKKRFYQFNSDGTGTYGVADQYSPIDWRYGGDGLFIARRLGRDKKPIPQTDERLRLAGDVLQAPSGAFVRSDGGGADRASKVDFAGTWLSIGGGLARYVFRPDGNGAFGVYDEDRKGSFDEQPIKWKRVGDIIQVNRFKDDGTVLSWADYFKIVRNIKRYELVKCDAKGVVSPNPTNRFILEQRSTK